MSINDILKSTEEVLFSSDIAPARIIAVLGISIVFGLYVFLIYRFTVNNEFYSKDFNRSLAILPVIVGAIILTIQSNLVISLGMVGALSIVRYRTAIKSSLDLLFLFWSISLGIISGAGLFAIGFVLCVAVTLLLFILEKIESPVSLGLMVIDCSSLEDAKEAILKIKKNTSFLRIKNETIKKEGVQVICEYKSRDKEFDSKLKSISEISQFTLLNHDRENRI